ncbi:MAG: AraC family transcriptional regulator ligand-binding domain-containing protein [Verrucomicrobiota bacterium]
MELPNVLMVDPESRISDVAVHRLCRTLCDREPDVALPLTMASGAPLEQLSQSVQHAENLREAILFLCRYRQTASDRLLHGFRETESSGTFWVEHPLDHVDLGFMGLFALGLFKRISKEVVSKPVSLSKVSSRFPAIGPPEDYERYFGCPVYFDAAETGIVFPGRSLDMPLRFANSEIFKFCNEYYSQVLRNLGHSAQADDYDRLETAIAENAKLGIFDTSSAASSAHMSLRNAQRVAASRGTSLKDLIKQIRSSIAKELIRNLSFEIEEISRSLGYSDESGFRRAFKSWTGQTPAEFRNPLRRSNEPISEVE